MQAKFKEALAAGGSTPPPAELAACLFGLAESLQQGAEATVAACNQLPDASLTADVVQQADSQASTLFAEAVASFQRVLEGGQPRVDALVCSGNALSSWAEVVGKRDAAQALQLLQQATDAYQAALQREQDALVGAGWLAGMMPQAGAAASPAMYQRHTAMRYAWVW